MPRLAFDQTWPAAAQEWTVRVTHPEHTAGADAALEAADDRGLVAACLAGRREAFDVIVRRHQRRIYHLCFRFAGSPEDASDLTQDVFIRAYRGLRGFKGGAALATWLYRIGVNVCLNRAALKQVPTERLDRVERPDFRADSADAMLLREERAAQVRAAIARLPPTQRATLILRVYHELPHDAIAEILGSSVGATKANLFHALANLRKLLQAG